MNVSNFTHTTSFMDGGRRGRGEERRKGGGKWEMGNGRGGTDDKGRGYRLGEEGRGANGWREGKGTEGTLLDGEKGRGGGGSGEEEG